MGCLMQNSLVLVKVKQRANKIDSSDYDNFETWQIREAFNKAQLEWVRRQIHGANQSKEGDEETKMRVDDLQILLKQTKIKSKEHPEFYETELIPVDYLYFKRLTPIVTKDNCKGRAISSHLREEANVDEYLSDWSFIPSFDFEETFHTMIGNKFRLYTAGDFKVKEIKIVYYRKPREIDFGNCEHIDGTPGADIDPEFKDDIVELIIDDAVSILAGDIESPNQFQISKQRTENNN
jgi:hypothetical protein